MAAIEASPVKVIVRKGQQMISCVNHFQTAEMEKKNRKYIDESFKRDNYLRKINRNQLNQADIFHLFIDEKSPLFLTDYKNLFGMMHTFSYSSDRTRILTSVARSNQILDISFDNWVKGENIKEKELTGFLNLS
ncbi:hypothetical protein J9303_19770 [Bacillaceae bacterium Marseille-Q3522]|nr:hypothetical protein [Bacillaceae bacterium Marseille-Q3522]